MGILKFASCILFVSLLPQCEMYVVAFRARNNGQRKQQWWADNRHSYEGQAAVPLML